MHPNPDRALSDGAQSLTFDGFRHLIERVGDVAKAVGRPLAAS
jgi:3-deoxy-7-phosphoheptulonate synthase